jgi:hypothetical protein
LLTKIDLPKHVAQKHFELAYFPEEQERLVDISLVHGIGLIVVSSIVSRFA